MIDLASLPSRAAGEAEPVLPPSDAPIDGGRTVPARKPDRASHITAKTVP
jgi:hypothetical protein